MMNKGDITSWDEALYEREMNWVMAGFHLAGLGLAFYFIEPLWLQIAALVAVELCACLVPVLLLSYLQQREARRMAHHDKM